MDFSLFPFALLSTSKIIKIKKKVISKSQHIFSLILTICCNACIILLIIQEDVLILIKIQQNLKIKTSFACKILHVFA